MKAKLVKIRLIPAHENLLPNSNQISIKHHHIIISLLKLLTKKKDKTEN